MSDCKACSCGSGPKLIFACSGAADVGAVADLAARKLNAEGAGKMFCMAGIGGKVSGIMATTESASSILAIDGCALDCVKNSLTEAGFNEFEHLKLYDHGMIKGQSPATPETVEAAAELGRALLNKE